MLFQSVSKLEGTVVEQDDSGLYVRYLMPDSIFTLEYVTEWNGAFGTPKISDGTTISYGDHYINSFGAHISPFKPANEFYSEFDGVEDMVTMLSGQAVVLSGGEYSITIS